MRQRQPKPTPARPGFIDLASSLRADWCVVDTYLRRRAVESGDPLLIAFAQKVGAEIKAGTHLDTPLPTIVETIASA